MDTIKDKQRLETLLESGARPWRIAVELGSAATEADA